MRQRIFLQLTSYKLVPILLLTLSLTSCFFSARGIYFEQERAVAERAVVQYHDLFDAADSAAIYELFDKTNSPSREDTLPRMRTAFQTLGKIKTTKLAENKVIPSPMPGFTSQVRMIYDTQFEKGNRTEFFAWNIKDSRQAFLIEYRLLDPAENPAK